MIEVRKASIEDLPAITEIYNDAILKTTATFDTTPKTHEEQLSWFGHHDEKFPVIVAVEKSDVVGWASLSRWSDRCAYSDTAEVSFYVHEKARGRGVGRKLLQCLVKLGKEVGHHTLVSRIAGESEVSVHLHEEMDFFHIGTMKEVGRKFGKLLDVHLMQKML